MSNPIREMEWQLRALMEIAAGEPAHPITVRMVRRVARRRTIAAVAAAVAIVLIGGVAAAVAARTADRPQVGATGLPSGVPRYYYGTGRTSPGQLGDVIRATASGAVTATVRCPGKGDVVITSVVPVGLHTFFMMCHSIEESSPSLSAGRSPGHVASESRIYGFRLTRSGRISGYFPVRGGRLAAGMDADALAATPDGSRVAIIVPPGSFGGSSEILVIDTRTGAHTWWRGPSRVPGQVYFSFGEASITGNGKELAVLGPTQCIRGKNAPKCKSTAGEEIRAFNIAGPGGQLGPGKILLRQSAIMPLSLDNINEFVISPDGRTLTLTEAGTRLTRHPKTPEAGFLEILQVAAGNNANRRVIFKMNTGNGFSYRFFSADPFRRHFILDAGGNSGPMNGWIYRGRLIPLKPTQGDGVIREAW